MCLTGSMFPTPLRHLTSLARSAVLGAWPGVRRPGRVSAESTTAIGHPIVRIVDDHLRVSIIAFHRYNAMVLYQRFRKVVQPQAIDSWLMLNTVIGIQSGSAAAPWSPACGCAGLS